MIMIIEWHDASKVRPCASCDCLVMLVDTGMVDTLSYSKKHDAFNASDFTSAKHAIEVAYWAKKITMEDIENGSNE